MDQNTFIEPPQPPQGWPPVPFNVSIDEVDVAAPHPENPALGVVQMRMLRMIFADQSGLQVKYWPKPMAAEIGKLMVEFGTGIHLASADQVPQPRFKTTPKNGGPSMPLPGH